MDSSSQNLEQLADTFQALAHETRLKILLAIVAADTITMTVLAETIGLTVPRTSELVTQLERAGFCKKTKLSSYVTVSLSFEAGKRVEDFFNTLLFLHQRNNPNET